MGLGAFFIFVIIVVLLCALAAFVVTKIPRCPSWAPQLIWYVGLFVVVLKFLQAIGLFGHDVMIPHV